MEQNERANHRGGNIVRFGPCKGGDKPAGLRFLGPALGLKLKWIGLTVWPPSCAILGLQKRLEMGLGLRPQKTNNNNKCNTIKNENNYMIVIKNTI